jgi:hypothetical protein
VSDWFHGLVWASRSVQDAKDRNNGALRIYYKDDAM